MMSRIQSPYERCPVIAGENLEFRLVSLADAEDLLSCYSDPKARQLFNSDNCTHAFEYSTLEEMESAIKFWIEEYRQKNYVRFSILDTSSGQVIGTVEMFTRMANDGTTPIGLLRIDLQSGFEEQGTLDELVRLIEAGFPQYFAYTALVTKIVKAAEKRMKVFQSHGFAPLRNRDLVSLEEYYGKYY